MSDPISDMLTRIRNASSAGHEMVEMPHSRMKDELTRILKREGFIVDFAVDGGKKKVLRIYLKYDGEHKPVIKGIKRESLPGLRKFVKHDAIPRVLGGLGTVVLSTSRGLMTGKDARGERIGGELVCSIW